MRLLLLLIAFSFHFTPVYAQSKSISITIDDVPNTRMYSEHGYRARLLEKLDSLAVPYTVFINEEKVYQSDSVEVNKQLLERWIAHPRALVGNHSYSHSRYSDVGFEAFAEDVRKGALLSREYAGRVGKAVEYFRFPYNDMGKDTAQHLQMRRHLLSQGYVIAPFTVESSDWMYSYVYQHYLKSGDLEKARAIGEEYVATTLELLRFFEELAQAEYQRPVRHIYLCHDNPLNVDYLPEIISRLRQAGYQIDSFRESLSDPVYAQQDRYFKKWGVSWLYRWMKDPSQRTRWMKLEPQLSELQRTYNDLRANE